MEWIHFKGPGAIITQTVRVFAAAGLMSFYKFRVNNAAPQHGRIIHQALATEDILGNINQLLFEQTYLY